MTETADNTAYSLRAFFVLLNIIFLVTTLHILETLSKIMEEQNKVSAPVEVKKKRKRSVGNPRPKTNTEVVCMTMPKNVRNISMPISIFKIIPGCGIRWQISLG